MTVWIDELLTLLAALRQRGYHANSTPATEPTALAALALAGWARHEAAQPSLDWLVARQQADGSVGVNEAEATPTWPTSLAVLAWNAANRLEDRPYQGAIARGTAAMLALAGDTLPRSEEMGHDSTLVGWPWVDGTHSWIEPTAWHVLALKAIGMGDHPRCREGVRLLFDRLLPGGGCNYGNTSVLGQTLRGHVEPTGLALLALAGEQDQGQRLVKSLGWLSREVDAQTTAVSLCYAILGLAAHGRSIPQIDGRLRRAYQVTRRRDPSGQKLSLLALAALGETSPLIFHTLGAS